MSGKRSSGFGDLQLSTNLQLKDVSVAPENTAQYLFSRISLGRVLTTYGPAQRASGVSAWWERAAYGE